MKLICTGLQLNQRKYLSQIDHSTLLTKSSRMIRTFRSFIPRLTKALLTMGHQSNLRLTLEIQKESSMEAQRSQHHEENHLTSPLSAFEETQITEPGKQQFFPMNQTQRTPSVQSPLQTPRKI